MEIKIQDNSSLIISEIRKDLIDFEKYEMKPIQNPETAKHAGDLLKGAKKFRNEIEDKRKELVKPFKTPASAIDKKVRPYRENLDEFIKKLSEKIYEYKKAQNELLIEAETKRREEEIKSLTERKEALVKEAQETGSSTVAMEAAKIGAQIQKVEDTSIETFRGITSRYSTTTVKEKWSYEVVDASKVPKQFLEPSDKLIKVALKGGVRKIEGLEIKDIGTVRSN